MRGPSLQATTLLSAALHLTFLLIAALILRHSRNVIMPSPYEVSLVGPVSSSQGQVAAEGPMQIESGARIAESAKQTEKPVKDKQTDLKRLEDRVSEIASKKKVERIVKARKMITVGGQTASLTKKPSPGAGAAVGSGQPGSGTYENMIASRIGQEIVFPETAELQLTTIVFVRIMKDGTIQIQNIEKRSGNTLFDRAALSAIAKASPVTPPPAEMEIGLRLHPYGREK